MEIQLFGPVTVLADGRRVEIDRPSHQLFLGILASVGGQHMPAETLIDAIWPVDDRDPRRTQDPVSRLYELVSDVRAALNRAGCDGRAILTRGNRGYALAVDRDEVDLLRFHHLRQRADTALAASRDEEAVTLFREAFRQWGGNGSVQSRPEPYAGLVGSWVDRQRVQLDETYRTAFGHCAEAELRLGRHRQLLPELVGLITADPLNEYVAGLLMCAYYGGGQSDRALEFYTDFRKRLVAELGNEPGALLQNLHQRVLNRDPELSLAASPVHPGRVPLPRGPSEKEPAMAEEHFSLTAQGNAKVGAQVGKLDGNFYAAPQTPEPSLDREVRRLGRQLRAAYRSGRVSSETTTAAQAELNRARAHLDGTEDSDVEAFVAALEDFQRLVDGADDLVDLADAVLDAARKGER